MKGTLWIVGIGPGDPEDLTLRAARVLRECDVLALPGREPKETLAYRIAVQAVPELANGKPLLGLPMPMTRDPAALEQARSEAAELLNTRLAEGQTVACPVLGDPLLYGSVSYLAPRLRAEGCAVEFVSGITSFCAAAARLGKPLAEGDAPLSILPVSDPETLPLEGPGMKVLMKAGTQLPALKARLEREGRSASAVVNCGQPEERICRSLSELPEDAGYFTLLLVDPEQ